MTTWTEHPDAVLALLAGKRRGCRCGHVVDLHEHYHSQTYCGTCGPDLCPAYRPVRRRWFRRRP